MPLAAYENVELPPRRPLAHTLLDVADVVYESDGVDRRTFAAGVEFRPPMCVDAVLGDPTDAPYARDDADDAPDPVASAVFLIDIPFLTTARGADPEELAAEAAAAMELATPKAIEAQLWTGSAWTTPGDVDHQRLAIAAGTTVLNSGDALAGNGLSDLLDGIAACGDSSARVIHATTGVVNGWVGSGMVGDDSDDDARLRTKVGHHDVIAGAGYPGTNLTGGDPAAGSAWVHVTHRPKVWLGNIEVHGTDGPSGYSRAAGRQENWVRLWAQRPAIVAFDPCCHLAAVVMKSESEALSGGTP